jgi:hypothetical protein
LEEMLLMDEESIVLSFPVNFTELQLSLLHDLTHIHYFGGYSLTTDKSSGNLISSRMDHVPLILL